SGWTPDLFYSTDFVSRLAVYSAALVRGLGGFRPGFEGGEGYDLALRAVEQIPEARIRHIPHVLYHARAAGGANGRHDAHERERRALGDHLERCGSRAAVSAHADAFRRVVFPLPAPAPLVGPVAPT